MALMRIPITKHQQCDWKPVLASHSATVSTYFPLQNPMAIGATPMAFGSSHGIGLSTANDFSFRKAMRPNVRYYVYFDANGT
jgi:hypothetical protein